MELDDAIETRCKRRTRFQHDLFINEANVTKVEEECVDVWSLSRRNNYSFGDNSLIALIADHTKDDASWIGKTNSVVTIGKIRFFNQDALV